MYFNVCDFFSELPENVSNILKNGIYRPNYTRNIRLIKYGCVSEVTEGNYTLVSHPVVTIQALGLRLRNQVAITPANGIGDFAVEGDSGAVVFESIDENLYATCMVEGTMGDGRIVATPLIDVFVALRMKSPSDEQKLYNSDSDESDMDCYENLDYENDMDID